MPLGLSIEIRQISVWLAQPLLLQGELVDVDIGDPEPTFSIDGNRPLGKISVTMNLMNRASSNLNGMPRSTICGPVKPVIECSNVTPSAGKAVGPIAKKSSLGAVSRLCNNVARRKGLVSGLRSRSTGIVMPSAYRVARRGGPQQCRLAAVVEVVGPRCGAVARVEHRVVKQRRSSGPGSARWLLRSPRTSLRPCA